MRTVGIICEYNPFHMGHKRQIDTLRTMGYDCVVCVMSGNFTQRGELAMFDKYTRAQSAILGGADLVLELPFPYSSLSAEGFATAGVHILSSLGIKDISFGSECANKQLLCAAADAILSQEFIQTYTTAQKNGAKGSARVFFESLSQVMGQDVALLSNDILAISYIAAIKRLECDMNIIPIKREGLAYNDKKLIDGQLPSASAIRQALKSGERTDDSAIASAIPENALSVLKNAIDVGLAPITAKNIDRELLSFFKVMTPDEIVARAITRSDGGAYVGEDGCGICERLCNSAKEALDFDEFISNAYNAKYTDARINRVALFALFGVSDIKARSLPHHTTLLAASKTGRSLLSKLRKSSEYNIVTKPADAPDSIQTRISHAADELYVSAMPKRQKNDYFIKCKPYMADK